MSLIEETKTIPETTRKVTRVQCDLCPAQSDTAHDWDAKPLDYTDTQVVIHVTETTSYPEGSHADSVVFDCCPECFKTKVAPALVAIGMTPRDHRVDW